MKILRLLSQSARSLVLLTGTMALLNGVCNAGLIAVAHRVLSQLGRQPAAVVWAFVILGLGKLLSGYYAEVMLTRYTQRLIAQLRQTLVAKLLDVPLRHVERIGAARVLAALTDDITTVTQALQYFPSLAVNMAMLLGGAAYLCWLSWRVFLLTAVSTLIGTIAYRRMSRTAHLHMRAARDEGDRLFGHYRALTEGLKELKLNRQRRQAFLRNHIATTAHAFMRHSVVAASRFTLAHSTSHLFFFVMMSVVLFVVPLLDGVDTTVLYGYVLTSLYLMGPLGGSMRGLPVLSRANIALVTVERLGVQLDALMPATCAAASALPASWQKLELAGVTYTYEQHDGDHAFGIGPVHLTVTRGELLFVTGGNGSGKSTLGKLLGGLYAPDHGDIRLDGLPITAANRDDYRQLFAAVFADFYLFDPFLGQSGHSLDAKASRYLHALRLATKVTIDNGRLSSTDLSQGQRKRLALLSAYLEDRPIYLFDEWASDQDPQFKEFFYRSLLPDLRAHGKTVIVITHDDRYFDCADRCIKMSDGLVQHASIIYAP